MKLNIRIGRLSPQLAECVSMGYGKCYRCRTPWNIVDYHVTKYTMSSGCFPLCVKCWAGLSPHERLPFYRRLIEHWYSTDAGGRKEFEAEWANVKQAVEAGL